MKWIMQYTINLVNKSQSIISLIYIEKRCVYSEINEEDVIEIITLQFSTRLN